MDGFEVTPLDTLLRSLLKHIVPLHHERVTLAVRDAYGLGYAAGVREYEGRVSLLAEAVERLQKQLLP